MTKFITAFLAVMLFCADVSAGIEASVSRTTVTEGENIQVYLRSDAPISKNDFAAYRQDFDILGTQSSSRMTFVNGKQSQSYETIFTLSPKRTGKLILPSVTALGVKTNPIEITVLSAEEALKSAPAPNVSRSRNASQQQSTPQNTGTPKVIMRAELSNNNILEGTQTVYTLKLYTEGFLENGSIVPPESSDYTLEKIGNGETKQTTLNNIPYLMTEYKFSLTPKKTGTIHIPASRFVGTVPVPPESLFSDDPFSFDPFKDISRLSPLFGGQRVSASAPAMTLTVKARPSSDKKNWLPAQNITIADSLSPTLNHTVGDAITRTITVTAKGGRADLIPDISFPETPEFKQYPSKPEVQTTFHGDIPVAKKTRQIVFIPTTSGTLTLPATKIDWYDTTTGKQKSTLLQEKTLTVAPAATPEQPTASVQMPLPAATEQSKTEDIPAATDGFLYGLKQSPLRLLTAGAFLGAGVLLFLFFAVKAFVTHRRSATKENTSVRRHTAADALRDACSNGDPSRARDALKQWAATQFPENPPLSLTDLARRFDQGAFTDALNILNKTLYGSPSTPWDADALWKAFSTLKSLKTHKKKTDESLVPPLYPL